MPVRCRWAIVLCALAACDSVFGLDRGDPAVDAALVDAPALVCQRDPFSGTADADDDGDTVPNGQDSCPITRDPREEDHNEDADCRGDICDLCPQDPTPTGDADGDGVGDACDYRAGPDTAIFEGFTNADEFITGGSWTILSSSDQYLSPAGGTQSAYRNVMTKQNGVFEAGIVLPTSDTFDAGLLFSIANISNGGDGDAVTIGRTGGGAHALRLLRISSGTPTLVAQQSVGPLVADKLYVLRVGVDVQAVKVTLTGGDAPVAWAATLPTPMPTNSSYGLVSSTATRFNYLFRVEPR
jgi:hypothetical protein